MDTICQVLAANPVAGPTTDDLAEAAAERTRRGRGVEFPEVSEALAEIGPRSRSASRDWRVVAAGGSAQDQRHRHDQKGAYLLHEALLQTGCRIGPWEGGARGNEGWGARRRAMCRQKIRSCRGQCQSNRITCQAYGLEQVPRACGPLR